LAIEEVILSARREGRINIMGFDANAVLGISQPQDDDRIVGPHGHGQRNLRGDCLADWLHGLRLSAVTTMRSKPWEQIWTHKAWSDGARRQIDYILTDEVRLDDATDIGIAFALDGKSDHRGVLASFLISGQAQKRRRRTKVQRG
jgi:hypothetical protein